MLISARVVDEFGMGPRLVASDLFEQLSIAGFKCSSIVDELLRYFR